MTSMQFTMKRSMYHYTTFQASTYVIALTLKSGLIQVNETLHNAFSQKKINEGLFRAQDHQGIAQLTLIHFPKEQSCRFLFHRATLLWMLTISTIENVWVNWLDCEALVRLVCDRVMLLYLLGPLVYDHRGTDSLGIKMVSWMEHLVE